MLSLLFNLDILDLKDLSDGEQNHEFFISTKLHSSKQKKKFKIG